MKIIEPSYGWASELALRKTTTYLILHHAAVETATAEQIHEQHLKNGWLGIGYHYYVRKNGGIHRGRPERASGAHCAGYNSDSIGICFEGNFEIEEMTKVQLEISRELVADVAGRYPGIKIGKHKHFGATACPGKNFPFEDMIKRDAEEEKMTGKQIFEAYNTYAAAQPIPDWAREELAEAVKLGITDGENLVQPVPRYQSAIMALRAIKNAAGK